MAAAVATPASNKAPRRLISCIFEDFSFLCENCERENGVALIDLTLRHWGFKYSNATRLRHTVQSTESSLICFCCQLQ